MNVPFKYCCQRAVLNTTEKSNPIFTTKGLKFSIRFRFTGSRNPSENMHNELQNNRPITAPAESFSWRPDDFAPPLVEPTNNEPFDVNFWNSAATESTLSNSQATSESPISRPSESHQHQHVVHDTTSPPVIQLKEIECKC